MKFSKDLVLERLRNNPKTHLFFIKVDGSQREMNATLDPVVLREHLEADKAVEMQLKHEPDLITVYDLDVLDWRSFYIQNLVEIEGLEPE